MNEAVLDEAPEYPGVLELSVKDPYLWEDVNSSLDLLVSPFVGHRLLLHKPSQLVQLFEILENKEVPLAYTESASRVIDFWGELTDEENTGKLKNPKTGEGLKLFPYQVLMVSQALQRDFFFFNSGTGTGKTVMATSGLVKKFEREEIDLVLFFTLKAVSEEVYEFVKKSTDLRATLVLGDKAKRRKLYGGDSQVFVLNYEKCRKSVDLELLRELVRGKRVLFVLDEVQRVLSASQQSKGLKTLLKSSSRGSAVWALSASVVNGDPERFFKVFGLSYSANPLGAIGDFRSRYLLRIERKRFLVKKNGRSFYLEEPIYIYNTEKLKEVPLRVVSCSQTLRKTDPEVVSNFKNLSFFEDPLTMTRKERNIYREGIELFHRQENTHSPLELFQALQFSCLNPESHKQAKNSISAWIRENFELRARDSAKLLRLLEDLTVYQDAQEKVLVFTHWNDLSLKIIQRELEREKISTVVYHGGQSQRENEEAKYRFKTDPKVTVFLSTDSGSHGINMPEARVVLNYDCPFHYDTLMQRNSRIDRADSYLEGLESHLYYYHDSIEQHIWEVNNQRRILSSNIQGTNESLGESVCLPEMSYKQLLSQELGYAIS